MSRITIDPSIATTLDINNVGFAERSNIYFNADENWAGTFEFSVYNSAQKNTVVKPANALSVSEKRMHLLIRPSNQGLTAGMNYYEIVSLSTERVVFKGNLNIIK
jgi:hypothetical protein